MVIRRGVVTNHDITTTCSSKPQMSVAQGPLEFCLPQIRKCKFLVTLSFLNISSKKRSLKRYFTYHLKAHTISNKMVSKVSAQKKGGKSYDCYKCVQISVVSGSVLPRGDYPTYHRNLNIYL